MTTECHHVSCIFCVLQGKKLPRSDCLGVVNVVLAQGTFHFFLRGNRGVMVGFGEGVYKNVAIEGDHPRKLR